MTWVGRGISQEFERFHVSRSADRPVVVGDGPGAVALEVAGGRPEAESVGVAGLKAKGMVEPSASSVMKLRSHSTGFWFPALVSHTRARGVNVRRPLARRSTIRLHEGHDRPTLEAAAFEC